MKMSLIDTYLLTNKTAVKAAIKLSVSVWGALFIALLLGLEHPIWSMITGMISFFAPDHAQVLKKCLYQCISTLCGGILGLALMGSVAQSPFLAALCGGVIIFLASAASFHTRDANVTFCCSIFTVTVCIMIMVPAVTGPSSDVIIDIFIDRVGTILCGIFWAGFVSACLWPSFSTDAVNGAASRLFSATLELVTSTAQNDRIPEIYAGIINTADLADHADFEGSWGRRAAGIVREMNRLAIQITTRIYTLQQQPVADFSGPASALRTLQSIVSDIQAAPGLLKKADLAPLEQLRARLSTSDERDDATVSVAERLTAAAVQQLIGDLLIFATLFISLLRAEKVSVKGLRIRRHSQPVNCLITGLRSMLLFYSGFAFWYATGWQYGFLIAVIPIVFSLALAKAPHPAAVARNVLKGALLAIPFGFTVSSILGQASSAVELLILTAGIVLFFGFMGLTSMMTFAYSLGFCISFMIFLLPENHFEIDMVFPLERSLSLAAGTFILSLLFSLLPRRQMIKDGNNPASLYDADLEKAFLRENDDRASETQLHDRMGLLIDKLVDVVLHEAPEKKRELIHYAGQSLFLMSQLQSISAALKSRGANVRSKGFLLAWRREIYRNYRHQESRAEHPLAVNVLAASSDDPAASSMTRYLQEMDRITRRAFVREQAGR